MRGCARKRFGFWRSRLAGAGYRMTTPRGAVLSVLQSTREHLSAEEIYLEVRKKYPVVGIASVYRTLELLSEMGFVFKFDFGDKRARYEIADNEQKGHHHHLVCTSCGRIINCSDFIDKEKKLLTETEKGLSQKYNFEIRSHLIQFYGLCESCRDERR